MHKYTIDNSISLPKQLILIELINLRGINEVSTILCFHRMPEREVKRNPIRSLYHYYKAISSEFKEWASDHCFLFFLIILFIILQFIIIAVLALAIVNSYTGIVRYSNDYYWKGQKKYGHAHGTGKLFNFADILVYEGTMSFDKYDGQGISFYINGEKEFEGEWEMGMKKKGSFYSLSGQLLYDGECKDNIYQGYGDAYENGVLRFRGTFDNGFKRHGIFYDDNGNILYSGSCVDDLFHGYGEYYSNNHLSFSGSFVDGMRSGRGVSYSNSNHPLFIGIWEQDSMEYGLLFNKKGDIVTRGKVPSSIIYIQHDQDLSLLNDSTEEIVIAPNTHIANSSLEISHLPQLKYITVLNGSCQNVTSFYLHDLPSLEIIQVNSKSFSHLNELGLFDMDSIFLDSAMNGSVIIENCKVLKTIDFAPFTFVHFNNLSLSSNSTLFLLIRPTSSIFTLYWYCE